MRALILFFLAALVISGPDAKAESPAPPPGLHLIYAVTVLGQTAPTSSIYLHDITSGSRRLLYQDSDEANRVLIKIAASDIVGAARAVPPADIYLMMGPTTVDPAVCTDALCRLRVPKGAQPAPPERLFLVPLCFSDASPYGLWNRAPIFAVAEDGKRVALPALRAGDEHFDLPSIRVLTGEGVEEWRIPLEHRDFYVADLAWSPDGKLLAYLVMPIGDAHTLDDSLLPKAGLYLADIGAHTTRLLHHCYADAVTWGPKPNRITAAARLGDFWGSSFAVQVVSLPTGKKVEEFSLPGPASSLAYSDDGQWLAAQVMHGNSQQIHLYPASEGWGKPFYELPSGEGRLSLLGWAHLSEGPP